MNRMDKLRALMSNNKVAHETDPDLEAEEKDQNKPENEDKEELTMDAGKAHIEAGNASDPGPGGGVDDAVRDQDKANTTQGKDTVTPDESAGHVTDKDLKDASAKKANLGDNIANLSNTLNGFLEKLAAEDGEEDEGKKQEEPEPDRKVDDPEAEKDEDADTGEGNEKEEKKEEDKEASEAGENNEKLATEAGEEFAGLVADAMIKDKMARDEQEASSQVKYAAQCGYEDGVLAARALDGSVDVVTSNEKSAESFGIKSAMEDMQTELKKQGLGPMMGPEGAADPMAVAMGEGMEGAGVDPLAMGGDVGAAPADSPEAMVALEELFAIIDALIAGKSPETPEEQEIYDALVAHGLISEGAGEEAPVEEAPVEEAPLEEEIAEEVVEGDPLAKLSKEQKNLLTTLMDTMVKSNDKTNK